MATQLCDRGFDWARRVAMATMFSAAFGAMRGEVVRAEGVADQAHSLRAVPATAAFYSASLRLEEQWKTFVESNTYDRLMEVPIFQMAKMQIQFQWQSNPDPTLGEIRDYFQSEEGERTLAIMRQMFADEVFLYGGEDIAQVLSLFAELNSINRAAGIEAATTGRDQKEVMAEHVYDLLDERGDEFKVPNMVIGFRVEDRAETASHLDHLQAKLVELLEEDQPEIAERIDREQIGGHEFVTLRLDGSMLPWDKLREESENLDDEQFGKWKRLLSDKSVAVAIGVVEEFVLVSIGDSTEHVEKFGEGEVLADHAELARLEKHAEERITSIAYVSEAFAERVSSPEQTVEDLVSLADDALGAAEISSEDRAALVADLRAFGKDLLKYTPSPSTYLMVNYLTGRGYEGFEYRLGTLPMLDDSEPLSILSHVGGDPLGFFASRSRQSVEQYDETIESVKRLAVRVEKLAEEKAPSEEWAKYMEYRDEVVELLARLDHATREHLFPALKDGQQALVIDVAAESQRWIDQMPKSPKALPMLELGVATSVSDAEHLRAGIAEYFAVAEDVAKLLHEANPEEVPAVDVPEPEKRELDGGTMYTYPLPAEWGIDAQVAISGAVTKSVAAASAFPAFTERLLQPAPLKIETSIDMDRAAAQASHFQCAKLIDAVSPWIDYGFDVAMGKLKIEEEDAEAANEESEDEEVDPQQAAAVMQMGFVLPQIHQLLNVAKAIQSRSSITYHEDDAWVTHFEMHLKDIE
jgi:hypothetical protein